MKVKEMKYTITGKFNTGDSWEEDAKNKRELEFVLNKAFSNATIITDSVRVINNKNEDITAKIFGQA